MVSRRRFDERQVLVADVGQSMFLSQWILRHSPKKIPYRDSMSAEPADAHW